MQELIFRISVYSSYSAVCRSTFALSTRPLLFCSTFVLLYDEERQQQRLQYISLTFMRSYTYGA